MPSPNSRRYGVAPLFCCPWTLNGISPRLIESHYEHIYCGCVARFNAIAEEMAVALARDFGSVARWRQEFIALGEALAGGSGWVLLNYLPRDCQLVNHIAAYHDRAIAG